jgi:choline dehydrogenase
LHNYLKDDSELDIAVRSVELVRKIVGGTAMSRFAPEEIQPTSDVKTRDELISYARDTVYTTFHPVGTCKMGRDRLAVVDDRLRVHGLSGLRVVDASIMPVIVSGNTQAATVMIAEKAADFIAQEAREAQAA